MSTKMMTNRTKINNNSNSNSKREDRIKFKRMVTRRRSNKQRKSKN